MPHDFPPHGLAVQAGDVIFVLGWSNVAAGIRINLHFRPNRGAPHLLPIDVTITSNRLTSSASLTLQQDGIIDGMSGAGTSGGGTQRGQTFIQVVATKGSSVSTYALLAQAYVFTGSTIGLYQIEEPGPAGGPGAIANQGLTQPAAGVDFANFTIPTGSLMRLRGFFGQLVTGAGVANREFSIQYLGGGTIKGGVVAGEIQTASLTVDYVGVDGGIASSGTTSNLAGGVTGIGLGNMVMTGLVNVIQFKTYNIQAADQWGTGALVTEEWVVPN